VSGFLEVSNVDSHCLRNKTNGFTVGQAVGTAVGTRVGENVGSTVGFAVTASVGKMNGNNEELGVGLKEGFSESSKEGDTVH
jgi:hypothetical protein